MKYVYVLLLDWAEDMEPQVSVVGVYSTFDKAKKAFREQLKSEKEFNEEYDLVEVDSETEYLAYNDGESISHHCNLRIIKKELE